MISAIILAAGQSRRMGQPKLLLPWGDVTVIGQVLSSFLKAGIEDIVVVTGGGRELVETAIQHYPVRTVFNPGYALGEMLSSLQCGLRAMSDKTEAALIALGDQPQIQQETIRSICEKYRESKSELIIPSFRMRRGHPWLVARSLWKEVVDLNPPESPRDFLNNHADDIRYVDVETPSILADLDTPEDYRKSRPDQGLPPL